MIYGFIGKKKRKKSTAHDVNKATEHSQKGKKLVKKVGASKTMAAHDVTIEGLASTIEDVHDEIKKLADSLKEMTETMKKLEENLLTKADLPEKETSKEKVETSDDECSFPSTDPQLINEGTLYVKGFDTSVPRNDIKRALIKHFGSCGELTRVYVPFHYNTVFSKGYAFIDLKNDHYEGLNLNGSYLGESKLEVMLAMERREYICSPKCGFCNHQRIFNTKYKNIHKLKLPRP